MFVLNHRKRKETRLIYQLTVEGKPLYNCIEKYGRISKKQPAMRS